MEQVNMFLCILFTPISDNNLIEIIQVSVSIGVGNMITRFDICVRIARILCDIT